MLEWLGELVGENIEKAPAQSLSDALGRYPPFLRKRWVARLAEVIDDPDGVREEGDRVMLAKAITCLLPHSEYIVRRVLAAEPDGLMGEFQFSIFVFLSDIYESASDAHKHSGIKEMVKEYLNRVSSPSGQAAWMAGDMLGDHWPLSESLPVLLQVARDAKHETGRGAALHGLAHALPRASQTERWMIVDALKRIAAKDKSYELRRYAIDIIGDTGVA